MEFYSAMKKKEIMFFAGKWMELEDFHVKQSKPSSKKSKEACFPSYASPVS
jgi:hypothetical protein